MSTPSTKQIDKEIRIQFKKGIDKSEIYSVLAKKYPENLDSISRLLKQYPDLQTQQKYKVLVNILLVLLVIVAALKIMSGIFLLLKISPFALPFLFFIPLINIWMIVEISRYKQIYFFITGCLAFVGAQGIKSIEAGALFAIFAIPIAIIAFYIGYKFKKNIEQNHNEVGRAN
jgi:hypothetical protein